VVARAVEDVGGDVFDPVQQQRGRTTIVEYRDVDDAPVPLAECAGVRVLHVVALQRHHLRLPGVASHRHRCPDRLDSVRGRIVRVVREQAERLAAQ
jgi:hypothetical protein